MSHTLDAPHLLKKKPRRPDSAVLILVVLSLLFGVVLSMPDADEETGNPIALVLQPGLFEQNNDIKELRSEAGSR
jgi:hypothetical protein